MNKKQWIVLGIGLIIMGIFFNYVGGKGLIDCNVLSKDAHEIYKEALDSDMSILETQSFYPQNVVGTCHDLPIIMSSIGSIFWGLGIIFVILGFLEDKKKK